jgi:hypothetical protein
MPSSAYKLKSTAYPKTEIHSAGAHLTRPEVAVSSAAVTVSPPVLVIHNIVFGRDQTNYRFLADWVSMPS